MNSFERISCLLGSLLLGVSAMLIFKRQQQIGERSVRQASAPVEELAEPLQKAWEGYHNR